MSSVIEFKPESQYAVMTLLKNSSQKQTKKTKGGISDLLWSAR